MLIAEQKLKDNDIAGAKRFACKAKSMCHDLEGIEQLICTIDVLLVSAETKDSYEILSLDRSADRIALKKKYRKLALQLHPDKNKSHGADAAFKAVDKAYRALSENNNTELKGHSTSTGESQQNSSKATTSNPAPSSEGEPHGFGANNAASEPGKKQETGAATNAASDPPRASNAGVKKSTSAATPSPTVGRKKQKSGSSGDTPVYRYADEHRTFWTLCDKCNIQFKHPTVYRNHTIECHVCRHHYQATEIPAPTMDQLLLIWQGNVLCFALQ